MTQAVTRYQVLFESLASRRRRPHVPKGFDVLAVMAGVRVERARASGAWLRREAERTADLSKEMRACSEAALDDEIARVREVFMRGKQKHEQVRRGLALVREVARRRTGEEAYPVQLMGALAMYHGRIIEMLTGEGKTLTGSLVAPLLAWRRRHVHVFTVNDYLAARDAESRRPIYARCLVDVGAITQELEPPERAKVYARGVVYGTPKQIVADWLRDQIKLGSVGSAWVARNVMEALGPAAAPAIAPMMPGLRCAMVDEADAVLIDEGVVPLIIARVRREDDMAASYRLAAQMAGKLDEGPDYEVDRVLRRVDLRRRGEHRLKLLFDEVAPQEGGAVFKATRRGEELVRQALVAKHCYTHGQHYQIVEGKVMIVDEYTGRFLQDRQWEHGLHQAVEAKEGLDITADRETLARMSFQRFYRSYPFLCGMTGTAADATAEMERVYGRPVVVIPTNKPILRKRWKTRIFRSAREKWHAIALSVEEISKGGRPVLVGTRSIAASELLSHLLTERRVPHQVLNAKNDKEEAPIIERAGELFEDGRGAKRGTVTVATNMAGRGTDIKPTHEALAAGGLHVVLTEMHGAKRIDRQFFGRAGRQGDPGSAQMFLALDDELVTKFTPKLAHVMRARSGWRYTPEGELATTRMARAMFRLAQRRSEARDRTNRAGVLRHDDWVEQNLPGA